MQNVSIRKELLIQWVLPNLESFVGFDLVPCQHALQVEVSGDLELVSKLLKN